MTRFVGLDEYSQLIRGISSALNPILTPVGVFAILAKLFGWVSWPWLVALAPIWGGFALILSVSGAIWAGIWIVEYKKAKRGEPIGEWTKIVGFADGHPICGDEPLEWNDPAALEDLLNDVFEEGENEVVEK